MKISPLSQFPERPDPIFDNTRENGTNLALRKAWESSASFDEETTFLRRHLGLSFFPCVHPGKPGIVINDDRAEVTIDNIGLGNNNIGMLVRKTRVQIIEHVLGLLAGLGIDADIMLRSSVFPFRAVSLPTKADCVQQYADALMNTDNTSIIGRRRTFTVAEPTRIDFENKRGSYAILLPDEGKNELIVDVMVSYPGVIGTQRAKVKINDDVMRGYIAGARTPSYGLRRRLMGALDTLPVLQKVVNINTTKTVSLDQTGVTNPRTEYDFHGTNIELLMHETLDKLGAYGIPLRSGARFVGTIMVFAAGHGHDLSVMRAMQNGGIDIVYS